MKASVVLKIASLAFIGMTGFAAQAANQGMKVAGYECTAVAGVEGHRATTVWGSAQPTVQAAQQSALEKCKMETVWGNCAIDTCWFENAN